MSERVIITDDLDRIAHSYLDIHIQRLCRIMHKTGGTFHLHHLETHDSLFGLLDDIADCERRIFRLNDKRLRLEGIDAIRALRECLYSLAEDTWSTIIV